MFAALLHQVFLEECCCVTGDVVLSDQVFEEFQPAVRWDASNVHVLPYLQADADQLKQLPIAPHSSALHSENLNPDCENL